MDKSDVLLDLGTKSNIHTHS